MNQNLEKHSSKVIKVILSCTTYEHVLSTRRLISNFHNYWGHKGNRYNAVFESLLRIKQIQLQDE
jgi:hypothetical protein